MPITKNIVTDYGADNTGAVDCSSAFVSLKADMAGQDCTLTIPAGTYTFKSFISPPWAGGQASLTVNATGATITSSGSGGVVLGSQHMSQIGIDSASGKSARIQSASSGATSVTLTSASASSGYISRFSVGQWMIVTGYNIQDVFQSPYGFPPNFHFIDFVKITGIVGNTISFTGHPLNNSYFDTWPEVNRGSNFEVDAAGPATIYAIHSDWDHTTTFNDGTYTNGNLIKCESRDFIMNGGDSSGGLPIFPTVNKNWTAINHTANTALVEHDKLCDYVEIQGGTYQQWHEQSSSTRLLKFTGAAIRGFPTATNGGLNGTPRNTILDNCDVGYINIGPTAYGRGDTFTCTNSTIAGTVGGGIIEKGPGAGAFADHGMQDCIFMSGGVITVPRCLSERASRWCVPDASGRNVVFWSGDNGAFESVQILSVTGDPWPAVDDQSATTNVTIATGTGYTSNLTVSSSIFSSGDVGKVIQIPGAGGSGSTMNTFIYSYNSPTSVVVFGNTATPLTASSKTLRWGTCNNYIQTNKSGGLPSSSIYGTKLSIRIPPARSVYFSNCTGTDQVLDLCQAGAQNKPLWSYSKRTYDGSTGPAGGPSIPMLGNIVSFKVNVTKAYTGVQSTLTFGPTRFNNLKVSSGGAFTTYGPRINLKITGERVVTIGNTTGAQSGDTNLNLNAATFIDTNMGCSISQDISGESSSVWPSFTVEMITDQGFATAPVAVAPLRLRLRAA